MENQEYLECPYEKSHLILKHRMQIHLGKCRRNHLNVPKKQCPFNVTHLLNEPELEYHIAVCPERKTFENFRHVDEAVTKATVPPPMEALKSDENWDDDGDAPSYNPTEYVAKAPVIRNIMGAPPSARKKFRQQERLRLLGTEE